MHMLLIWVLYICASRTLALVPKLVLKARPWSEACRLAAVWSAQKPSVWYLQSQQRWLCFGISVTVNTLSPRKKKIQRMVPAALHKMCLNACLCSAHESSPSMLVWDYQEVGVGFFSPFLFSSVSTAMDFVYIGFWCVEAALFGLGV